MSLREELLREINVYLAKTGMTEAAFGHALGNSRLVKKLRGSGTISIETADSIRHFIRSGEVKKKARPLEGETILA